MPEKVESGGRIMQFLLPDLGEGLTEGEILKWLVAEGDTITLNQPIVEVETAKAAVEIPAKWAGKVTKIFHPEGTTVEVGTPIIAIDTDPSAGDLPEPSAASLAAVEVAPAEGAVEPGMIGGMAPGGRTAILVGYGPKTAPAARRPRKDAPPASASGAALLTPGAQPGRPTDEIDGAAEPDTVAGKLATEPEAVAGKLAPEPEAVAGKLAPEPETAARKLAPEPETVAGKLAAVPEFFARKLAKPPVRKLARDLGVDLGALSGSGPAGSITREDVHAAATGTPAGVPSVVAPSFGPDREQRIPVKGVRKLTAENMVASAFTAPHVTEFLTVDVTRATKALNRLRDMPEWRGVRVSPLLLVAKAVLLALGRHPMVNSTWSGQTGEIVVKEYVNLGIAAATARGLVVPNIKDAGRLSLRELADAMAALVTTAKDGRTALADMAGGTFTITNVGVFGVDTGTPILPPGEAAILAFGAVREMPWVHKGRVRVRQVTTLALSFDHRIIDGELGSVFLRDVGAFLTDPEAALLASS